MSLTEHVPAVAALPVRGRRKLPRPCAREQAQEVVESFRVHPASTWLPRGSLKRRHLLAGLGASAPASIPPASR